MPHRLLVVDDDMAIQLAMQDYFPQQGYLVDGASTRAQAEVLLGRECYAILITDLFLQGTDDRDGLAVVSYVRAHCPGRRIVMLTAYGSPHLEREARDRGMDLLLEKPQPLAAVAPRLAALLPRPPSLPGTA